MDVQVNQLVDDILKFSEHLPERDLYDLKRKIKTSAKMVTPTLRSFNQKTKRMEKIKSLINARAAIEEVQEYLLLSQQLRFGNTNDLNSRLDNILNNFCKMEIN